MNKKILILSILIAVVLIFGLVFKLYYRIPYSLTKSNYLNDENYCETNSDCVPENSCRPSKCVNKYYAELNPKDACCVCEYCAPCISSCECVDNQCKTNYQEPGCC